jgi:hypothetical protein
MFQSARTWLLRSGIQQPGGGVARYYRADADKYQPISAEITGYFASALCYLANHDPHAATSAESREAGLAAARYLTRSAWSPENSTIPFEPGSELAYFFDIGIIVRGLLAAWHTTKSAGTAGEAEFANCAKDAALALAFDFLGDAAFHPIITLPDKQSSAYDAARWSRRPGCYQLKSALAWHDVGREFEDEHATRMFESALAIALATHESFLPGADDPEKVMDRLHAYCYFLEALLSVADRPECAKALGEGIERVSHYLREISPRFERSDVCAQLLRLRLIAHRHHGMPLHPEAANDEARRAAAYQVASPDPRIAGGFWFGTRNGETLPFVNPVSTVFCVQALALWQDHCANRWTFQVRDLI